MVHVNANKWKTPPGGGKGGGGDGGGSVNESGVGVEGVSYKMEEFARSPGHGEAIPMATNSGINAMQSDLIEAGSKTGIISATAEQKSALVKQLNNIHPNARANQLSKMASHYLQLKGKSTDADSIEKQLNKWGLSGQTQLYHPK